MNVQTGAIYEGEKEIEEARQRGEPLRELVGAMAKEARALRDQGASAFASPRLAVIAKAERKRLNKAARRTRVAQGQRRRGKR